MARALVTGASSGLGAAIARALARQGHDLVLAELDPATLGPLLAHPDLTGRRVVPVTLDLRVQLSLDACFAAACAALGGIDLLVNNAGRPLSVPATEVTWEDWDAVTAVNLKGAFFLSAHLARHCIARGAPGAIVNIASTHGLVGIAGRSVYGISKGGMVQMTRMLAIEWAAQGIRVNAVAPGTVLTPSRQTMLADPARRQTMLDRIPLGRFPVEEEIADAVCYLAGAGAGAVTGQILAVDGGVTAA
ncbi:SDR family oxidoreductase [Roseomonas sp. E05]|uniref:SDR family NAD(P)-dependent oxidoreductase n=1 Tax=Roseomonas sp. E05 TaxID=3046310 RepID=UPI0024BBD381|nr:SDR family oxidoreductase [Roseomonas sp. E05]MDJ0387692.1 SDR family oxidoreductase [Roseomonas sp. E05]